MAKRLCACGCGEILPKSLRSDAKYLNAKHRRRVEARRARARKRQGEYRRSDAKPLDGRVVEFKEPHESLDGRGSARRGPLYDRIVREGYADDLIDGRISDQEVADLVGSARSSVTRVKIALIEDRANGIAREDWTPTLDNLDNLGDFTHRYFPKLLVPQFHLEFEEAIDSVVGNGGRLLLLAPQRFGKSEMLIRYCMKRIAQNPDISIGWVSKTQRLAEKMVGYVRQNLEHNTKFINDVLGPGQSFVPPHRSGLSWTNGEFTVANRTEIRKSPTMMAVGTGGTIVGNDFDLVILDDPQDRKRCSSPTQRDADWEWLRTDFLSRKEADTGVAFIMSRQHIEDLPGLVMRDQPDQWDIRIYRAHDPACAIPEKDYDAHTDCLLWPGKRTWRWLHQQKVANEAHFQRNYMNDPKTDATTYVTASDIANIRDHTRRVGDLPSGCRLVAGIDPAEAKPVAAVLWGYDGLHRHVIDCVEASASVMGLREILSSWPARYGVREFAFEKNMAKSWLYDTEVRELIAKYRLTIHQHYTDRVNKNSNAIGPVAMFQRMRSEPPTITLPGAGGEGSDRIDRLVRSWLSFDPDWAGHKHADDDLTMASWFPQLVIDSWDRPASPEMVFDYDAIRGL